MVMVRSGRKTAEVSVIWWLLVLLPQPPPSNTLELPLLLLCRGERAEASCLPDISLLVIGRTGCTGQFLLPEGTVGPNSSAGMGMGGSCLSLAGCVCGDPLQKVPL